MLLPPMLERGLLVRVQRLLRLFVIPRAAHLVEVLVGMLLLVHVNLREVQVLMHRHAVVGLRVLQVIHYFREVVEVLVLSLREHRAEPGLFSE